MIFMSNDKKNIFFINLKCAFSSFNDLVKQGKLKKISHGWSLACIKNDEYKIKNLPKDVKFWMVVRCPYKRFLSFYRDKFINCFYKNINFKFRNQECQINMYKYFDKKKIENLEFKISDLIKSIKLGYFDGHLEHQNKILDCKLLENNKKKINFLKLESEDFNKNIKNLIGHQFVKSNSTSDLTHITLSESEKKFVKDYYKKDFEIFNYDI